MDDQTASGVKEVASSASEQTRAVAHDAGAQASDLAGSVREQAGEVGHEVVEQGRRVLEDARERLHEQTDLQSQQAVSALRDWSAQGRALAEGRPEDARQLAGYARELSNRVSDAADRFEQRGVDGVVEDVKTFARRRPGVFLVGAGLAGFAAGRLLRGASSAPRAVRSPEGANRTLPAYAEPATPTAGEVQAPAAAYPEARIG